VGAPVTASEILAGKPDAMAPGPPGSPEPDAPAKPLITVGQNKRMYGLLGQHGMSAKAKALAYISKAIGRDIASTKELLEDEATEVIRLLENLPEGLIVKDPDPATTDPDAEAKP
jgi:hypothetical protein